ncbi:MAG: AIR synthase-related protein, partial [Candidatus Melainabacteria bacterium]|nr:AIR synthase-related protein [Candidatus Melainabacteria bacterium]
MNDLVCTRINIVATINDTRAAQFSNKLGLEVVALADSYLLEADLEATAIQEQAKCLIDYKKEALLESANLAAFDYALEIGFLPGVTDNVATTVKKILADAAGLKFNVYSSQILFIRTNKSEAEVLEQAAPLYNPLIQRAIIKSQTEFLEQGMGLKPPKVELVADSKTLEVDLAISDEELIELSNKGIQDEQGQARGPLALGLDYMKTIQAHFADLGRKPKDIELESIAQTWSEHCKHTIFADPIDELEEGLYKGYIKAATNTVRKNKGDKDFCVSVFTDNSGAIEFDDDYLITHKVETHNSPSALDPFGGAITGIVGVNRDAIGTGMGAKPVANLYGYCFGEPVILRNSEAVTLGSHGCSERDPDASLRMTEGLYRDKALTEPMLSPQRIMEGVIEGVKVGGNCSGIPTVHGFSYFHPSYRAKPLVFVGTLGLMPRQVNGKDSTLKAARPGDLIVVLGGRVGLDGIHGATFSSVEMDSSSPATAVQIGDPITQKKFSDAIIKEARDRGLYSSITDNGAGGISCSVAEMARECGGCYVELDKVPLKYPGMQAWQIWISESQERMTLAVPPENWDELSSLFK